MPSHDADLQSLIEDEMSELLQSIADEARAALEAQADATP